MVHFFRKKNYYKRLAPRYNKCLCFSWSWYPLEFDFLKAKTNLVHFFRKNSSLKLLINWLLYSSELSYSYCMWSPPPLPENCWKVFLLLDFPTIPEGGWVWTSPTVERSTDTWPARPRNTLLTVDLTHCRTPYSPWTCATREHPNYWGPPQLQNTLLTFDLSLEKHWRFSDFAFKRWWLHA